MTVDASELRLRRCPPDRIGLGDGRGLPISPVLLASAQNGHATRYLLAAAEIALGGEALTAFLDRVSPFGCPAPASLIRAYSLPDAPYPSILLREHEEAPDSTGDTYRRFLAEARQRWLAALRETGPGLCPALAWRGGRERAFFDPGEWTGALAAAGVTLPGVADAYVGRGLLMLSEQDLARSWQTMMSLGGVTKARKMTGREFPVWVDLPKHQPDLLASPVLARVERLFGAT